jgi:hypothetical protein
MRRRCLAAIAAVGLTLGCAGPRPDKPKLGHVAVREFLVGQGTTAIERYGDPVDGLGRVVAERIADVLREREQDAVVVSREGDVGQADLVVTGRLTSVDGGSRAKRLLASQTIGFGFATYGIGGAGCTIDGEVTRGDGTPVATFQQHCTKKGVGWFWTKYGESAEFQIRACLTLIGTTIAYLVDTGRYESGLRPLPVAIPPVPAVLPATTERTPGDRLRELERLRRDGLLNEREYQEKRELILKEL